VTWQSIVLAVLVIRHIGYGVGEPVALADARIFSSAVLVDKVASYSWTTRSALVEKLSLVRRDLEMETANALGQGKLSAALVAPMIATRSPTNSK